ncbi:unnamed protein product, partial [marine sediment metagenome]
VDARVGLGKKVKKRYTKGKKKGQFTKAALELREKRRAPGGIKKLDVIGRMKNSIFARASTRGVQFGSNVDYFGAHQGGTDRAGKSRNVHIDARESLPVRFSGGTWHLIKTGRAKTVWDRLEVNLRNAIEGKPLV